MNSHVSHVIFFVGSLFEIKKEKNSLQSIVTSYELVIKTAQKEKEEQKKNEWILFQFLF